MSIVFDANLPAKTPQTHAFVIGIADYPHLLGGSKFKTQPAITSFGLRQLSSPHSSAECFATWLHGLTSRRAPIGTIDLFLSPQTYTDSSKRVRQVSLPTMANLKTAFKEWSARTDANAKNVAIFYYCGHGFEKESVTILLPCDFGDPAEANVSANMIDFNLTYDCNLLESNAATQLYLIDACGDTPTDLLALRTKPTPLISTLKLSYQSRDAPVIRAANGGSKAHGLSGKPSFYTEALLACLENRGARGQNSGRWEITTSSLGSAMKWYMQRMKAPGVPQLSCNVGGRSNFDTVIHTFAGEALVMSEIDCDPDLALSAAQLSIRKDSKALFARPTPAPHTWEVDLAAGQYDVEAKFSGPPYRDKVCQQLMQPPYTPCTLEVTK